MLAQSFIVHRWGKNCGIRTSGDGDCWSTGYEMLGQMGLLLLGVKFHNWGNSSHSLTRVGTILPHLSGTTGKGELYCHYDNSLEYICVRTNAEDIKRNLKKPQYI